MNDAQAVPGESLLPASTDLFTIGVFVLIALFALAAIAIIVSGARRKRRRLAAEEVVQQRIEQADEARPPSATPTPEPGPAHEHPPAPAPAPAPVSPSPTPTPASLADQPITAVSPGAAAPGATVDDPAQGPVTQLKGLGPKVAGRLAELGITTVGDLAGLSADEATRLDARLGAFSGRMERDRWLEQARLLAGGDRAGFEAVFGRL